MYLFNIQIYIYLLKTYWALSNPIHIIHAFILLPWTGIDLRPGLKTPLHQKIQKKKIRLEH